MDEHAERGLGGPVEWEQPLWKHGGKQGVTCELGRESAGAARQELE